MGRPHIAKDENGKTYAWEAGDTFNVPLVVRNAVAFSADFYLAEEKEARENHKKPSDELLQVDYPDELSEEQVKFLSEYHGYEKDKPTLKISDYIKTKDMITDQEMANHKTYIKENAKIMHSIAEKLRNEKEPEKSEPDYEKKIHIWKKKKRIADHIDLNIDVLDPEKGNYLEAAAQAPYMIVFIGIQGSDPRFSKYGYDECIIGLDQLDVEKAEDRRPIFDTYMDVMDSGAMELKTEFHRQEMAKTGWDDEKERIYLDELKSTHEKIIDSFDKLCKVEDNHQYDKYLNNKLQHTTGKNGEKRDLTMFVGYARGELHAIENGYGSNELFVLGSISGIEAQVEKNLAYKKQSGEKDLAKDEKFLKEVKDFKATIWNKIPNSPGDALQTYYSVLDFMNEHSDMTEHMAIHNKSIENMKFRQAGLEEEALRDIRFDMPELNGLDKALERFNTKRTGIRMSDESKLHKSVREKAEDLQKDLKALKTGRKADGRVISLEEKRKLLEGISAKAEAMDDAANTYINERKGNRREAGNERKAGAVDLRNEMAKFKETMQNELNKVNEQLGYDPKLENEIKEALDYADGPVKPVEPDKKQVKKSGKTTQELNTKKLGENAIKRQMDKDIKKLRGMSTEAFHGHSSEYPGMNEWDYQLAKVLAERVLEIGVKKGQMGAEQALRHVNLNVNKIINRPGYKELVKNTKGNVERQMELANKKPGEILASMFEIEKKMKMEEAGKQRGRRHPAKQLQTEKKLQGPQ